MNIVCHAISSVGKVRSKNEDNFYINGIKRNIAEQSGVESCTGNTDDGLFAVCDGMGGESYGEIASFIGVETLAGYADPAQRSDIGWVKRYIADFNDNVCELIEQNNGVRSGSTLALLWINQDKAYIFNVGDSRVYLFRGGALSFLTQDHTDAQRKIRLGLLTPEQAQKSSSRHILTQCIGIPEEEMSIEPYAADPFPILTGDRFLLCSDGVTDSLTDEAIETILKQYDSSLDCSMAIIRESLNNGGRDNITVVMVDIR